MSPSRRTTAAMQRGGADGVPAVCGWGGGSQIRSAVINLVDDCIARARASGQAPGISGRARRAHRCGREKAEGYRHRTPILFGAVRNSARLPRAPACRSTASPCTIRRKAPGSGLMPASIRRAGRARVVQRGAAGAKAPVPRRHDGEGGGCRRDDRRRCDTTGRVIEAGLMTVGSRRVSARRRASS